jgi:hypothetical protein
MNYLYVWICIVSVLAERHEPSGSSEMEEVSGLGVNAFSAEFPQLGTKAFNAEAPQLGGNAFSTEDPNQV